MVNEHLAGDNDITSALLELPTVLRSMLWMYLDDHSAVTYLSTCHSLHSLYHTYPLKQPLHVRHLAHLARIDTHFTRCSAIRHWTCVVTPVLLVVYTILMLVFLSEARHWAWSRWLTGQNQWGEHGSDAVIYGLLSMAALLAVLPSTLAFTLFPTQRGCCDHGSRLSRYVRCTPFPRITQLSGELHDPRLLPFLKHVTEAEVWDDKTAPISKRNPLPTSLRTLRLGPSPNLKLRPYTLPPHLTSLSISKTRNNPLTPGLLPQSLLSLHLTRRFDGRSRIEAGVLPASLQQLVVDQWAQPLSYIVLPPRLMELTIHQLADYPLASGVLPPQLGLLYINGPFNHPLPSTMPSTLRAVHLLGRFHQPFTLATFASVQQLEELHLSDGNSQRIAPGVLPASLRVLRLGMLKEVMEAGVLPVSLQRLVLRESLRDAVDSLVPLHVRPRGLEIVFEPFLVAVGWR